jgi:hypothetical protein
MNAPQPLTGDELATIKARAERATPGPWLSYGSWPFEVCAEPGEHERDVQMVVAGRDGNERDSAHIAGMDPATTLRLVAEVERLRDAETMLDELVERGILIRTTISANNASIEVLMERITVP